MMSQNVLKQTAMQKLPGIAERFENQAFLLSRWQLKAI